MLKAILNQILFCLLPVGFKFLGVLVGVCQYVCCKLRGIRFEVVDNEGRSQGKVLVSKVVFRMPALYLLPASPGNFICWHEDAYPIEYLNNPGISLYSLDGEFVYFIQTKEHEELYDLRKHCFFFMAQIGLAEKLIRVHQDDLSDFMDKVPEPQAKVVWIYHSGRCGSTALAQAINAIGNWKTISEIGWLLGAIPASMNTYDKIKAYMTGEKFGRLAKACIKSQLLRYPADSKVCWKVAPLMEPYLLPLVTREFPDHKILYMTRRGDQTANSFYKGSPIPFITELTTFAINRANWFLRRRGALNGLIRIFSNGMMTPAIENYWLDGQISFYQALYCSWATGVALVKDMRKEHSYVKLMFVDYIFFMSNLRDNLIQVFEYLEIPESGLQAALESFREDSQANSAISRDKSKDNRNWKSDEISVQKCTKLGQEFGLPAFGKEIRREHFDFNNWAYIMQD